MPCKICGAWPTWADLADCEDRGEARCPWNVENYDSPFDMPPLPKLDDMPEDYVAEVPIEEEVAPKLTVWGTPAVASTSGITRVKPKSKPPSGRRLPILTYNDNDHMHRCHGTTLGQLQAGVVKGTITKTTSHSFYSGHELRGFDMHPAKGHYLKRDCVGSGKPSYGRTQNRIIVRVTTSGRLVENFALLWRHDERIIKLGSGFFKRAAAFRGAF